MDKIGTLEIKDLKNASPLELAEAIVKVLDSKKAGGLKLLHVSDKTVIADYFIICTGTSNTQIRALANEVEYQIGEAGVYPGHIEGLDDATWVLLDYASVIVHVFHGETRRFYNLEKLWADAGEVDISGLITEN